MRSNGSPTVDITIPPLGSQRLLPSIAVMGGQWNLVPVISLLPLGEIPQGTEVDANDYLGGNWLRAFTFAGGQWHRIVKGTTPDCIAVEEVAEVVVTTAVGDPIACDDDNAAQTPLTLRDALQIGRGYWVWFTTDDRIVP